MQLTQHFSLEEFERSSTAKAKGIDNSLNPDDPGSKAIIENLKALCEQVLEPLRAYAKCPIIISSGYRCAKLNSHPAVHGAPNSNHLYGYAADLVVPDTATGIQWFRWIINNLQFDELITERKTQDSPTFWIHVAYRRNGPNRNIVKENLIKFANL